ncbi:hypothetical protein B5X24_HaOG210009 [Helicoverpa armigera]|uniref:Uncharacterized protein n=1 Tax=Helicoverpa armigera TaxID=29058 RepID=A0A2W1BIQ6_HELAM|nr:hypothetical protein B5X24_HaOG210009 [Helicoverpa armigera]
MHSKYDVKRHDALCECVCECHSRAVPPTGCLAGQNLFLRNAFRYNTPVSTLGSMKTSKLVSQRSQKDTTLHAASLTSTLARESMPTGHFP